MYSVVLMVAMTGGGDVPAGLFNHGCCGGNASCYGCTGGHGHARRSHGCCGGGYAYGCCGGGHGHARRSHGCCGGNYAHGCCGGGHAHHRRGHGCCGGNYAGCYGGGCYGGAGLGGCYGGSIGVIGAPVVIPSTPVVPTKPVKPTDGKKSTMENVAPATIVVTVPADARLTIDGEATTSTSTQRVFVSPALEAGREYHYTLKAEYLKDGKPVTISKEVAVQAGNETRVTLNADSLAGVASR